MFLILDLIFVTTTLWFVVTQMLLPTIRGTKWFPIFHREAKLESELLDVKTKVVEKDLTDHIDLIRKRKGL